MASESALDAFAITYEKSVVEFDQSLTRGIERVTSHKRGKGARFTILQLAETGSDVITSARVLIDFNRAALELMQAETERVLARGVGGAEWTLAGSPRELDPVRIAFKSFFFFARAYTDVMYRVVLAGIQGGSPPQKAGSMSAAAKKADNPVALAFEEHVPGWLDWFRDFRDKRDEVKSGVNFSLTQHGTVGVGVIFTRATAAGGLLINLAPTNVVTVEEIRSALDRLSAATGVIELLWET